MSVINTMKERLIGKVITNVEYGYSDNLEQAALGGERYMPLPAKIINLGISDHCGDQVMWLEFEGHDHVADSFYVYVDEDFVLSSDN